MLALSPHVKLYLYVEPCDMRKGFDGLSGIVRSALGREPDDGAVYVFVNRRRDRLKLLTWEPEGFSIYYKRLEQGTLELPEAAADTSHLTITTETLGLIIAGIKLEHLERRKRYQNV